MNKVVNVLKYWVMQTRRKWKQSSRHS